MPLVTLTARDNGLPVLVNLSNVDYVLPAGGNGSNLHFSRGTIYVTESPAEIAALANNTITTDHITALATPAITDNNTFSAGGTHYVVFDATNSGDQPAAETPADQPPPDEPPAKPGKNRETK